MKLIATANGRSLIGFDSLPRTEGNSPLSPLSQPQFMWKLATNQHFAINGKIFSAASHSASHALALISHPPTDYDPTKPKETSAIVSHSLILALPDERFSREILAHLFCALIASMPPAGKSPLTCRYPVRLDILWLHRGIVI